MATQISSTTAERNIGGRELTIKGNLPPPEEFADRLFKILTVKGVNSYLQKLEKGM